MTIFETSTLNWTWAHLCELCRNSFCAVWKKKPTDADQASSGESQGLILRRQSDCWGALITPAEGPLFKHQFTGRDYALQILTDNEDYGLSIMNMEESKSQTI